MLIPPTDDPRQRSHWEADTRYRPCRHPVPIAFADQRIDYIESFFDVSQIQQALDIGCGNGLSTYRFLRRIPRIFGIDPSINMLLSHPLRQPARIARADGNQLPFADNAFDLVYGWEVLHHVSDPSRVVQEAFRASRRWILFAEPNRYNPLQFAYALYDREHRWVLRYSLSFLRRLVIASGAKLRHASRGGWIFPNVTPESFVPILKMLPFRCPIAISNWVLGEKVPRSSLNS